MDYMSIAIIIIVIFMTIGYKHDIAQCQDFIEEPLAYCQGLCQLQYGNVLPEYNNRIVGFNMTNYETWK